MGIKIDDKIWRVEEPQPNKINDYTWERVVNTIAAAEEDKARAEGVISAYGKIKADMKAAGMEPTDEPKEVEPT